MTNSRAATQSRGSVVLLYSTGGRKGWGWGGAQRLNNHLRGCAEDDISKCWGCGRIYPGEAYVKDKCQHFKS